MGIPKYHSYFIGRSRLLDLELIAFGWNFRVRSYFEKRWIHFTYGTNIHSVGQLADRWEEESCRYHEVQDQWWDHPVLTGWSLNASISILTREAERDQVHREEGNVKRNRKMWPSKDEQGKEGASAVASGGSINGLMPRCQASSFQDHGRIHCCDLKPSDLLSSITVAKGKYTNQLIC